jgi:hypothetical protein
VVEAGDGQAVYFVEGCGARTLALGSLWTSLNVGVRLRHSRAGAWTSPTVLSGSRRLGFGLCSGSSNPYGSASPTHFVGLRTGSTNWGRLAGTNWWECGHRLVTRAGATETTHSSSATGTLRTAERAEESFSAWYLRLTRLPGDLALLEAFLPTGPDAPTAADFEAQMRREVWKADVSNHSSYREFSIEIALDEATLGTLDTVNIFSDITDLAGDMRGIEWADVRVERVA